ncbi:MAG: glutaredoxin family protein [Terriglobia bacterium]
MIEQVKLFTSPTCPYCVLVKSFLRDRGVDYRELDVRADDGLRTQMIEVSGQMGVPVVEAHGQVVVGYNRRALEELTE